MRKLTNRLSTLLCYEAVRSNKMWLQFVFQFNQKRDQERVCLKLPSGQVLKDLTCQSHSVRVILGESIGAGGCAEIYSATNDSPTLWRMKTALSMWSDTSPNWYLPKRC